MELNKENLYQKYIEENKSRKECSEIFGCSEALIKKRLKIYEITKDPKSIGEVRTKSIMKKYNIRANKSLGQNVLIDDNVVEEIINSSRISKEDLIIEIDKVEILDLTMEIDH